MTNTFSDSPLQICENIFFVLSLCDIILGYPGIMPQNGRQNLLHIIAQTLGASLNCYFVYKFVWG